MKLIESSTGRVVCEHVELADRFWSRFLGLQFRRSLSPGHGLLLLPCTSVHTFCMRFPIDLVCLDDRDRVVDLHRAVRPWRVIIPRRGTRAVLELPAGSADTQIGEQLTRISSKSE